MATARCFATSQLVRSHLYRHYHRQSLKPFFNSATHCRPVISTPSLVPHLLRPLMSSPTSRTAAGEEPHVYTAEEWDAASTAGKLKLMLAKNPEDWPAKWGWVVYRTSYKPELDGAWAALQDRIRTQMRDAIAHSDAPDVADAMDWVFVEDAAALDGIARDALRRRFQAWALAEAPDLASADWARGARYEFFLQADEDALESVLQPPSELGTSYVNLVRAWPDPLPVDGAVDEDGEPIDQEDWMKMALGVLYPWSYVDMDNPELWYVFYRDPRDGAWM